MKLQAYKDAGWRVVKDPAHDAEGRSAQALKDKEFLWEIPCRKGGKFGRRKAHIYFYGAGVLGFTGVGMKLRRELLEISEVSAHQTGDQEFSVTFPTASFDSVAAVVKPYRKRKTPVTGPT
jgi:hypothetical protein